MIEVASRKACGGIAVATIAHGLPVADGRPDLLSGTPRAGFIDRWIYVFTAASFIVIVLTGFIPDSLQNLAMIKAHQRPPYSLIANVHAVVMGSFLLLLLAQTLLVAIGRCDVHRRLGLVGMVLAPALVVVGFILAPSNYHTVWQGAHFGPPAVQAALTPIVPELENILLLQIRVGLLFSVLLTMGLLARARDPGFHKRMMILGTAVTLPAAFFRMGWLPTTLPTLPLSLDLYVLLAISPMFAWDVIRNRGLHRAYWVWIPIYAGASVLVNLLWDTPWWHATARTIMGV